MRNLLKTFGKLFEENMLRRRDLRWTTKFLSLYATLMLIPVTFRPDNLGQGSGEMESEKSSIWTRIVFKLVQILITSHTFFFSFRTLEYASGHSSSGIGVDGKLDWDLVPVMFVFISGYSTYTGIGSFIFDYGRQLNTKIYNETLKFRGKSIQPINEDNNI